jgi:hypothetical protein
VDVHADGSGLVRAGVGLDDETVRELGDPARELRLDDLRQSGWEVDGPRKEEKSGLTWVRLAKRFAAPAEASHVAAELSGADGPFRDFQVVRERTFLKTKTRFSGLVDLTHGLAGLNDADLQAKLGDADLGLDLDGLRRRFGPALDRTVHVQVEARLPGRDQAWQPQLGQQVRLEAVSQAWNLTPVLPAAAALAFALTALVVAVAVRRRG